MITAQELDLDINKNGIVIVGDPTSHQSLQYDVKNGNDVTLKKGDINIEVKDIEKQSDGTFKGIIKYVEPYKALENEGADEGIEIMFSHENIFASSHS